MTDDEMVEAAILNKQYCRDAVRHAIQMEREACAKLVEEYCGAWDDQGFALATEIRARGEK